MTNDRFYKLCKELVVAYFNDNVEKTDNNKINEDNVFVVWICKTLQNHKALVSTTISDGMYYEITYNGDKNEVYFDAYKKWKNECIKLSTTNEDKPAEKLEENYKLELNYNQLFDQKEFEVNKIKAKGYEVAKIDYDPTRNIETYYFKLKKER